MYTRDQSQYRCTGTWNVKANGMYIGHLIYFHIKKSVDILAISYQNDIYIILFLSVVRSWLCTLVAVLGAIWTKTVGRIALRLVLDEHPGEHTISAYEADARGTYLGGRWNYTT